MAVLHPLIQYIQNQPIAAPQRRRTLAQPSFYTPEQGPQITGLPQQATTEQHVVEQLQKLRNRAAPPELTPGSRVKNISSGVAEASNFKGFYDQLQGINQIAQEQLGQAQAAAAIARIRASQAVNNYGAAAPSSSSRGGGGKDYGRAGGAIPSNPRENFKYAQAIASEFGWDNPSELAAWYTLGMKESGWRNTAQNPTSTAYGIGQFLDSTWKGYGIPKTSDPRLQVLAMARYIKARYGSPSRALAFHNAKNWY